MHENWQITGNSLKTVQSDMISISIYCQLCSQLLLSFAIRYIKYSQFIIKITALSYSAISMLTPNKTQISENYQDHIGTGSSTALKMKYLQDKLQMKEKKLEMLQAKVQEQQNYIQILQSRGSKLQKAHKDKQICIEKLISKIDKLQRELAQIIGKLGQKDKEVRKRQIEQIKEKQVYQHEEKLNKVLTKQNHDLISQRHSLKSQIKILTQNLQVKQTELQCQKQQISLLMKLNQQLKLQVEQLLFEVRMLNRRKQTNRLQDYQQKIDDRHQQSKQNKNNQNNQNNDEQLLQLLKLKIGSLEQQLDVSERRCKQLQIVILSQ